MSHDHDDRVFNPIKAARLETPERYAWVQPDALLRAHGLTAGHRVADIGCGTGFFTRAAAEIVGPAGRVYALDASDTMLGYLRDRPLPDHVVVKRSAALALPLPDACVHAAVLGFVLHEVPDVPRFLAEVARVLMPGGRLIVIEWKVQTEEHGPPQEHRISQSWTIEEFVRAGLEDVTASSWTESHYVVVGDTARPKQT